MDPVRLIQLRSTPDAFEQKRNEGGVIQLSKVGKNPLECLGVFRAHVRWQLHTSDEEVDLRICSLHSVNDRLQIGPCLRDRNATQAVISAQLQHENIDLALQHP